jgi:ribosomal protein S3
MLTKEMRMWKSESGVDTPIMYRYSVCNNKVVVCTSQPGWLIGRAGILLNKYSEIISNKLGRPTTIEFVEVGYNIV